MFNRKRIEEIEDNLRKVHERIDRLEEPEASYRVSVPWSVVSQKVLVRDEIARIDAAMRNIMEYLGVERVTEDAVPAKVYLRKKGKK